MNLLNSISQFPDEDSCRLKLKAIRDQEDQHHAPLPHDCIVWLYFQTTLSRVNQKNAHKPTRYVRAGARRSPI